ncbi:DNA-binding transcriptional regulator, LysR family [Seinonella peptonophila]|uniref:DNA-binding transcriptional regulator, LysR family n=1 Tax=Seinonella peptonophila TaxID=112248 RepID=A0A1M5AC74_9BACL|nr:LysR family transcriptional regulator [Seinonella peptonophila]SHF27697.1 DNA-binding transcriptional regulator, LysR family [Seinonella peptonophila]
MDLLQLKYFQKIAEINHLTRAAQELHITQPSLSQTIAKLERDLGVPLFDRQGRQIRLNKYGEFFLKKVEPALKLLEEGRRELIDMAGLERGTISIDTSFLPQFSDVINMFRTSYPDVRFHISQVSTKEQQVQLLESGELDLCITCRPIKRTGICNLPILSEDIVLVVPFEHSLADRQSVKMNEIMNETFIHFKKGHAFRDDTDELCQKAGFTPNIVCETDDSKTIIELVKSKMGVAFWLETLLEKDNPFHHLHITEPKCKRTYQLAWSEKRYLSLAARRFRDLLIKSFAS